jgi:hypothetical protein
VLTPPATGDPGTAAGCIPNVAPDLLRALRSHSRKFYVNVLTAAYPQGAVRGQLVR